jgi:hypothetical protein
MIAMLDLTDFGLILIMLGIFFSLMGSYIRGMVAARGRRIEAKVDLILRHLGIEYQNLAATALSAEVQALADDPAKKIPAIALHRRQTGVGLAEAKDAVEAYIAGQK